MKKSVLIMFHLLFWVFTGLLVLLVFQLLEVGIALLHITGPDVKPNTVIFNLVPLLIVLPVGAIIFYASYFSLQFFVKKPRRFVWLGLGYVIYIVAHALPGYLKAKAGNHEINHLQGLLSIVLIVSPVLYFNVFGFLFKTFIEWINDRKIKAELEKDRIESQLELLKSKTSPHFLFNTLNNIDVMIEEDGKKASEYLRKLSELLRFMLYESNSDRIPLEKEIEYIRKYIDLQKIRTANASFVKFEINGVTKNKYISPMILIHFIENAFKYATNKKIENAVDIRFTVSENQLVFVCKNHVSDSKEPTNENNGLGTRLLKQKLDLLYNDNYTLNTKQENNWYLVNLQINLNEH